jgi:hypothetical protein
VSEHAHGTKGYAELSAARIEMADGSEGWRFKGKKPNPYQVEHDVLFDAIRNNKTHNEAEYGATSTMTAIMGRMATYSGQEVFWDKAAAEKSGAKGENIVTAIDSNKSIGPEKYAWDAKPPTTPDANGRYPIPTPGVTKVS